MRHSVKFGQNYLEVIIMSEINFQELLQGIQDAEEHITEQTGQTMEQLLMAHYESLQLDN